MAAWRAGCNVSSGTGYNAGVKEQLLATPSVWRLSIWLSCSLISPKDILANELVGVLPSNLCKEGLNILHGIQNCKLVAKRCSWSWESKNEQSVWQASMRTSMYLAYIMQNSDPNVLLAWVAGRAHQWQRVLAGPTAIWPTLNSPKIAGIQYYSVLNIMILKLYNVL